jgi:hypothetical protein
VSLDSATPFSVLNSLFVALAKGHNDDFFTDAMLSPANEQVKDAQTSQLGKSRLAICE